MGTIDSYNAMKKMNKKDRFSLSLKLHQPERIIFNEGGKGWNKIGPQNSKGFVYSICKCIQKSDKKVPRYPSAIVKWIVDLVFDSQNHPRVRKLYLWEMDLERLIWTADRKIDRKLDL